MSTFNQEELTPAQTGTLRSMCRYLLPLGLLGSFTAIAHANPVALTDVRIYDGTGAAAIEQGAIIIEDGRIQAIGAMNSITIPDNAERRSLQGKTVTPGFINAHGHAGDIRGLETGHYSEANLLDQLGLYARYGITTVISLGDDETEGFQLRDRQDSPDLDRARLYVAGPVLAPRSPQDAARMVDETARLNPDFIKIRVDDNLGRTPKMTPEVYGAVIDQAASHELPVAVHIYYLEDARNTVQRGAEVVAHSVRDTAVDDAFVQLMRERDACYIPTFTREVSTYVYESEPDFFSDPFFLADADPTVLSALREPERQQAMARSATGQQYKAALPVAMANLKALADGGVLVAMGTDSGPPARFQGYFEHLEMWMMQDAGLTPEQILYSATGAAAECGRVTGTGTLEAGNWADLIIFAESPLDDIRNTRSIDEVWVAGNQVPRPRF